MSLTRKISSGGTVANFTTYVGEPGHLFYDSLTGQMRISDGQTPGGLTLRSQIVASATPPANPADGNLWFDENTGRLYIRFDGMWVDTNPAYVLPIATTTQLGGIKAGPGAVIGTDGKLTIDTAGLPLNIGDLSITGANISTINTNEDLSLVSNGTGTINVYGNFKVFTDGIGSIVSFSAASSGLLTITAPDPVPTGSSGALNIIGSADGSYQSVNGIGGMIHITGNDNALARITIDGYLTAATGPQTSSGTAAGYGVIAMRATRGTAASPLHVLANDTLASYSGLGYVGTGGYSTGQVAGLQFFAAEDFLTSASHGTYAQIKLAPVGTNAGIVAIQFNANGIVTGKVGSTDATNSTSSTTGAVTTAGGLGVVKDVWIGGSSWINNAVYSPYVGSIGNGTTLTVQGGADAQGAVNVKTNLFSITTTTLTTPAVQTNSLGHTTFTDLDPGSIAPTVVITGNTDSSTQTPNTGGVQLHVTGDVGMPGRIYNDGQADYAVLVNRRYNGTSTSPTAVLNTQIIGRIGATPYTSAGWPTISTARIDFIATEDQTGTNQGNAIDFYTIPNSTTTPQLTLQVASTGVITFANFLPYTDNTYELGSSTYRWKNVYVGPGTLYITDQTLNTPAAVTVNNGVFNINGIAQAQLPTILANTITAQTTSGTLAIGQAGDTGTIQLHRSIIFNDSTVQSTAGIPLTQKGAANGVATLGSDSKVTPSQLPSGAVFFKGTWDASTNTPTLADGSGTAGWEYQVSTAGTANLGSGAISYNVGDFVLYNGTIWQKVTGGTAVVSVNGLTGSITGVVFTSDTGTVTNTMLAGSISNSKLSNSSITTTAGTGITLGGSSVALGGTLTITNAGVTSNMAGTGISVSGATGAVTITNTGVTAATSGSGISLSGSTGSITITNTGVLSNVAGTHISVSSGTGNVTISTDATSSNTASTIVARDSSGNFAAGTITGNITGNAGTVTNGVYTTGSYSDPSWLTISKSKVGLGNVENTALSTSTYYIGTTQNTYGRSSGAQTLSGVSISGNAGTVTNGVYTTDTGTVTNTMLAGSIANNKLANSTISGVALGSNLATLTFGTHLTGTSYNGSTGVTIATDATSANTASTIVARDSSGNFTAGQITASKLIINDGGVRTVTGGTALTVDFSTDTIVLWSVPTGNGTITLANYTAGSVVRVIIRFTTARNIAMGVASANNSTTAGTTLTGTGGGAQFGANQAVELVYTCIDGTSTNTYVAASYV